MPPAPDSSDQTPPDPKPKDASPPDPSPPAPFASLAPLARRQSAPPEGLVLVSTPIGNLGDMSARAVAALAAADLVLCEDTRVTAHLCSAFGIASRLSPLHEHNEESRIEGVLAQLRAGKRVALVSDAGTPLVSDPGFRLVRAAIAEGLQVGAVPGANAALAALVLSGLPPLPFLVVGFPPPRGGPRRAAFTSLRAAERAGLSATLIFYEAPHRLAETLTDLAEAFGNRQAAVARELTKVFEEVRRGTLQDLAAHYASQAARGEICIVIGPVEDGAAPAEADLDALLGAALGRLRLKEAVAEVTAATGMARKIVYARALALTGSGSDRR